MFEGQSPPVFAKRTPATPVDVCLKGGDPPAPPDSNVGCRRPLLGAASSGAPRPGTRKPIVKEERVASLVLLYTVTL